MVCYRHRHMLNFHHLRCFWMIAEAGSLTRAASRMHVTHSTLSVQLRALEETLGGQLFERRGRRLVLTPFGDEILTYASDIFRLGQELVDASTRGASGRVGESYGRFVVRAKENPIGREVKIQDILNNMDLQRIHFTPATEKQDLARIRKYIYSLQFLRDEIPTNIYLELVP